MGRTSPHQYDSNAPQNVANGPAFVEKVQPELWRSYLCVLMKFRTTAIFTANGNNRDRWKRASFKVSSIYVTSGARLIKLRNWWDVAIGQIRLARRAIRYRNSWYIPSAMFRSKQIPQADVRGHFLWRCVSGGSRTDGSTVRSRCSWDLLLQLVVVSSWFLIVPHFSMSWRTMGVFFFSGELGMGFCKAEILRLILRFLSCWVIPFKFCKILFEVEQTLS